jgi:hypothetical protein
VSWGCLRVSSPGQLIPGYEHYTGHSWPALMHTSPATGHFILVGFRLVGALNVAVGLPLSVIALTAFRARQRWAWWTLLTANAFALGAPITYDLTTGAIGPFGLLEWLLLAAVLAPTITWRFFPPKASRRAGKRRYGGPAGAACSPGTARRRNQRPYRSSLPAGSGREVADPVRWSDAGSG